MCKQKIKQGAVHHLGSNRFISAVTPAMIQREEILYV
jgi:hypothetical protein